MTDDDDPLLRENRTLREEIESLKLMIGRAKALTTFEGRTAEQWAGYARNAERKSDRRENAMRAAILKLEEELGE